MRQTENKVSGAILPSSLSSARRIESFVRSAQDGALEERELMEGARQLLRARRRMNQMMPKGLPREASWDMMLILLINGVEGGIVYIKQLIIFSGETPATAMRKIDRLEKGKMLMRIPDKLDHRRVIVQLTERGREAMLLMLKDIFLPKRDADGKPVAHRPVGSF